MEQREWCFRAYWRQAGGRRRGWSWLEEKRVWDYWWARVGERMCPVQVLRAWYHGRTKPHCPSFHPAVR